VQPRRFQSICTEEAGLSPLGLHQGFALAWTTALPLFFPRGNGLYKSQRMTCAKLIAQVTFAKLY